MNHMPWSHGMLDPSLDASAANAVRYTRLCAKLDSIKKSRRMLLAQAGATCSGLVNQA